MSLFLVVHTQYKEVQIGLYNNNTCLDLVLVESKSISKYFICLVQDLLTKNNLTLQDIKFIAAHSGPAPFTTLRVSLVSINGIAYATGMPLIGVNGLDVFMQEHAQKNAVTIALLNAFCQEFYFGIYDPSVNKSYTGYGTALEIIDMLKHDYVQHSLYFIGNGVPIIQKELEHTFGSRAHIKEPLPQLATINAIAFKALGSWQEGLVQNQLTPLYLKDSSSKLNRSHQSHCQPTSNSSQ